MGAQGIFRPVLTLMKQAPEFFITTAGEYGPLAEPRACWPRARLSDEIRDDYMLIEIDPALIGQPFGLGATDIRDLIISTRLEGCTLFSISKWPTLVYVARILDDAVLRARTFTGGQVELIAWGALLRTHEEAACYAASFRR